jgi:hypothetical protein
MTRLKSNRSFQKSTSLHKKGYANSRNRQRSLFFASIVSNFRFKKGMIAQVLKEFLLLYHFVSSESQKVYRNDDEPRLIRTLLFPTFLFDPLLSEKSSKKQKESIV